MCVCVCRHRESKLLRSWYLKVTTNKHTYVNHYPFNLDYNTEQVYPRKLQFLMKFWGMGEEFSFQSSVLVRFRIQCIILSSFPSHLPRILCRTKKYELYLSTITLTKKPKFFQNKLISFILQKKKKKEFYWAITHMPKCSILSVQFNYLQ